MVVNRNKSRIRRARALRNDMTDGEWRLWRELRVLKRTHGIHVRRQVPIDAYVVDFAIIAHKLVIELDGEHHFTAEGIAKDARRDAHLNALGYRVVRINTGELEDNLNGCIETILYNLGMR